MTTAMTTATSLRRPAEHRLERVGDRRLAERADADRGHRDPDLAGRDVLVDPVDLGQGERRPARSALPRRLELRALRPDERVLGDHEEPVHPHQEEGDHDEQQVHRGPSPPAAATLSGETIGGTLVPEILRGGSSFMQGACESYRSRASRRPASAKSAAVSPPAEWVDTVRRTRFQPWTRMSGWWFGRLGDLGHRIDQRDRAPRSRRPRGRGRSLGPSCAQAASSPSRRSVISWSLRVSIQLAGADRQPRAPRHRAAVRARPRR